MKSDRRRRLKKRALLHKKDIKVIAPRGRTKVAIKWGLSGRASNLLKSDRPLTSTSPWWHAHPHGTREWSKTKEVDWSGFSIAGSEFSHSDLKKPRQGLETTHWLSTVEIVRQQVLLCTKVSPERLR